MEKTHAGWQLCPKCNGNGNLHLHTSPTLTGSTVHACYMCNRWGIISIETGFPPSATLKGIA